MREDSVREARKGREEGVREEGERGVREGEGERSEEG